MARDRVRVAAFAVMGLVALGPVGISARAAEPRGCLVRNVSRGTTGTSFRTMVRRAVDGDRLVVRGICSGGGVAIRHALTIRGAGGRRPVITADRGQDVLRVTRGSRPGVQLRHLVLRGVGRSASVIRNTGTLTIADSRVTGGWAGIDNTMGGRLTVLDSIIERNGLGILNEGADSFADWLVVRRSVVRQNGVGISTEMDATVSRSRIVRNEGRGIENGGRLVLRDSLVAGNRGGGISNAYDGEEIYGEILVVRTTIARNSTAEDGAGLWNSSGPVTIRASWITDNAAAGDGGGIWNDASQLMDGLPVVIGGIRLLDGSAVTGNAAGRRGGGIHNRGGRVVLDDSPAANNRAVGRGGGIWNGDDAATGSAGVVILRHGARVSGNAPEDCHGTGAC